jgi:hypothetical protein
MRIVLRSHSTNLVHIIDYRRQLVKNLRRSQAGL